MDTQTQIDRLIELAIIQRSELKQLVEQLPQLREHLNAEVEKVFDETEPQLRAELEEWTTKQTTDKTAALGVALEAKITNLAKSLEISTQARYNAIIAEREENARLAAQAEAKISEHAASLPSAVKEIVSAELARFPRAGEIDQLRKEFAEPRGLNPRGKWQAGETYNKLDLVTINGDSYTSNTDGNRTRPSRSSADWTLVAARGTGGGGGPTSLSELTTVPSDGDVLIGSGTSWVTSNLTAGAGISITVGPGAITISATDGDITLDDGTAASPSLHFTNDPDTGIYRPAANTLGISVSGTQIAYFDENGLTIPSAGVVAGGSIHAGNGNANNPSLSFDGDQDTGFFRHQQNEIGIALGGTQYATLTSTTFSITPVVTMASSLRVNGTTDSSNKDTGAIVTEGGLGVEKSATIGGNLTVSGSANLTSSSNNSYIYDGTGWVWTSTGTSGGTVKGGIYTAGGELFITANSSLATNRFALTSSGNATVAGNLTVSGGTATISAASAQATLNLTSSGGSGRQYQLFSDATGQAGIFDATGSTFPLLITTTTLSTARNLTVSGTGTSDFSGNIRLANTKAIYGYTLAGATGALISSTSSNNLNVGQNNANWAALNLFGGTGNVDVYSGATGFVARFNTAGNVLVGSTADGGQKLQVAGAIRSTGNIESATSSNGYLDLAVANTSAGTSAVSRVYAYNGAYSFALELLGQGFTTSGPRVANRGYLYCDGAQGLTIHSINAPLRFWTGNPGTEALVIDTSQNATFAGNITVDKATPAILVKRGANTQNGQLQFATGASGDFAIGNRGTSDSDLHIYNYGLSADAVTISKNTSNATFAGSIAIGNTVNTVSPTSPNRTITMVIGGTTYYIHAKTTND